MHSLNTIISTNVKVWDVLYFVEEIYQHTSLAYFNAFVRVFFGSIIILENIPGKHTNITPQQVTSHTNLMLAERKLFQLCINDMVEKLATY